MDRCRLTAVLRISPMLKPCLDCGVNYTKQIRCDECQRNYEAKRGGSTKRGYSYRWQQLRDAHLRRNPVCVNCGASDDLTVDHIVPLARGGKSSPSNLQTLCRSCNSAKRDR